MGLDYDVIQKYTRDYTSILGKMEREGVISREEHVDRLGALHAMTAKQVAAYNQVAETKLVDLTADLIWSGLRGDGTNKNDH